MQKAKKRMSPTLRATMKNVDGRPLAASR